MCFLSPEEREETKHNQNIITVTDFDNEEAVPNILWSELTFPTNRPATINQG